LTAADLASTETHKSRGTYIQIEGKERERKERASGKRETSI
jgi:hypothetical protein